MIAQFAPSADPPISSWWQPLAIPLAPTQTREPVTSAIRVGDPGVTLWSRQPIETNAANEFDAPLTYRHDETDSMLV